MATKYRAAIIGCGSIANWHARGYQGVEGIEICAIADPIAEAREPFGDLYGVARRYADPRQMLDEEKPDLVSVATWHRLHAPLTIAACARRPKAVLCEKPMGASLGECDEMLMVAKRNGVKLAIAHQRRFNAAWNEARRLIAAGAIGQVRHVHAVGAQGLLNDCSHLLDMMRYVLGDPRAEWVLGNVERKTDRYERDVPIEDRSGGTIQFDNGTIGVLLQELGGRNRQGGVFYGTEGIIDLDEQRVQLLNADTGGKPEDRPMESEDPAVAQARELMEWAEGTCEHRGQAENGRAAIEIIMAIYESARRHEVVQLPLTTRANPLEEMISDGQLPVERPGAYDIRAFLLKGEALSATEAWGEEVEPS